MGNKNSNGAADSASGLDTVIDKIAIKYIISPSVNDINNFGKKEFCDKLVVLVAKIIDENVKGLAKEKCKPATFYVKLGHLYATILKTVNPVQMQGQAAMQGQASMQHDNLCMNHFRDLLQQTGLNNKNLTDFKNNPKVIKVTLCGPNKGQNANVPPPPPPAQPDNRMGQMPGDRMDPRNDYRLMGGAGTASLDIELEKLYVNYDEADKTTYKKDLNKDLAVFYKAFTGQELPSDSSITKFSEIPLVRANTKLQGLCNSPNIKFKIDADRDNEKLFTQYGEHLAKMLKRTNASKQKLLDILTTRIFDIKYADMAQAEQAQAEQAQAQQAPAQQIQAEQIQAQQIQAPATDDIMDISIKPNLTESELNGIINTTRQIIVNLYTTCEEDYLEGLKILEAIVSKKVITTDMQEVGRLNRLLTERFSSG